MKPTIWTELKIEDCIILDKVPYYNGQGYSKLLIQNLILPGKKRWFIESKKGNYYSRYTDKAKDYYAQGYIIKKEDINENN